METSPYCQKLTKQKLNISSSTDIFFKATENQRDKNAQEKYGSKAVEI